jgi:hypothetical protein
MTSGPGVPRPQEKLVPRPYEFDRLAVHLTAAKPSAPEPSADVATPVVFVVMPFASQDLQIVYYDFVKPAIEERCGLTCVRGDELSGSNVVVDDVLLAIRQAWVVIADLTGQNPNVFYEVGLAHAFQKPVLLMTQTLEDVPFDLRHRRVLTYEYTPRGCKRLELQIEEHVRQMLDQLRWTPAR